MVLYFSNPLSISLGFNILTALDLKFDSSKSSIR